MSMLELIQTLGKNNVIDILCLLNQFAGKDVCSSDLEVILSLSQPQLSKVLKRLKTIDFIEIKTVAQWREISLKANTFTTYPFLQLLLKQYESSSEFAKVFGRMEYFFQNDFQKLYDVGTVDHVKAEFERQFSANKQSATHM